MNRFARAHMAAVLMLMLADSTRPADQTCTWAEERLTKPVQSRPQDVRSGDLQNLNGFFPMQPVEAAEDWPARQAGIRRRILVSQGLWPLPPQTPLNAVVHGRVVRDDYSVDRVYFESIPGHFVTGSLYRPLDKSGPCPGVLSPHGHWADGRFYGHGTEAIRQELVTGAERFEVGGRHPIQARAVQLARMGCIVLVYDMIGYADSVQLQHRPDKWSHLDTPADWGFFSVQADLRLQSMMGLQTWNSWCALDFLLSLPDVDPRRIGVTGASGGGTQSMIIAAIDDRVTAAMPCVMVSTAMQGGCTCENASLLRIDQGNVDIAAAIAPRPLGLTAADDWTVELRTQGFPDLARLYELLGHRDRLTAAFNTHFKHNYNHVNRAVMYAFFNRHFNLGLEEPILERDYQPLTREEATVWTDEHPVPSEALTGDAHERKLLTVVTQQSDAQLADLVPETTADLAEYRHVVGGAWETILGRTLERVGEVQLTPVEESERPGCLLSTGFVEHKAAGEQLPALFISPQDGWNREIVLWFTDEGSSSLLADGEPIAPIRQLIDAGYGVVSADLFGQGAFTSDGQPLGVQPLWFQQDGKLGWQRYAGYTFGYNHSLFAKRVHDILTMVKCVQTDGRKTAQIHLVGIGPGAGSWVLAARSQAGDAIEQTFADPRGFRFQQVQRHDDPQFVPGAVKYHGLDGLLSLCAPHVVATSMVEAHPYDIAIRTYTAAGAPDAIRLMPHDSHMAKTVVDTLTR